MFNSIEACASFQVALGPNAKSHEHLHFLQMTKFLRLEVFLVVFKFTLKDQ